MIYIKTLKDSLWFPINADFTNLVETITRAHLKWKNFYMVEYCDFLTMAISKILDFSAGSKFAIQAVKLPQDTRHDRESQNYDWVLFSVTRF